MYQHTLAQQSPPRTSHRKTSLRVSIEPQAPAQTRSRSRASTSPTAISSKSPSRSNYYHDTYSNSPRAFWKPDTPKHEHGQQPHSIPHLREALHSLETQMANLMTERRKLESRLEQAVRLQSPVQRLPKEILGSIFIIGVLQMEEEDTLLLSTLMLVCKYWTEVALSTPVLWSKIAIGNHGSLIKAKRKLERSKSVPLDISLQFSPRLEHASTVMELVVRAMDLLRPSIWRWRSFRLAVPNRPHAHAALMQCREEAPLLEDLSVQVFHFMQDDSYSRPPLPLFGGRTPHLQSCSFTSFNFNWDSTLTSNLRELRLGGYWHSFSPEVSTILSILRSSPNLEEFSLRNMSDVESDSCPQLLHPGDIDPSERQRQLSRGAMSSQHADLISLPYLKKASFYYAGIVRVQAIFSQLEFPALERVEFAYLDNLTPVLKHLKRQSFTSLPLRHLRIESSFFNELKLIRLFQRLPLLHTLELVDVEDMSPNFLKVSSVSKPCGNMCLYHLQSLSSPPVSHTWICPRLETLSLDGCTNVEWDSLRTLIESRLPTNSSRMLNPPTSAASLPRGIPLASAGLTRRQDPVSTYKPPKRLKLLDVTRCHQISKEMLQWLRIYIAEVRYESSSNKGLWGNPADF